MSAHRPDDFVFVAIASAKRMARQRELGLILDRAIERCLDLRTDLRLAERYGWPETFYLRSMLRDAEALLVRAREAFRAVGGIA